MEKSRIFVSAICPIRDEEQSILIIFNTFPRLIYETELIFIEGGSKDRSWKKAKNLHGKKNKQGVLFRTIKQIGRGKGEAVKTGFNAANGSYLIIVDADLVVKPNDLKSILLILIKNKKDVIACGNRLKGIKKPKAFYWINYIGNYFFRYYYSFILKDSIKDISCGSKAMKKDTWEKIAKLRKAEGALDKWGDIDWLYYGKKIGAKIKYIPVSYSNRLYGESKLQDLETRLLFAWDMFIVGIKITQRNIFGKNIREKSYNSQTSKEIWSNYYSKTDLQTILVRFLANNYFSHAFALSLKEILPKTGKILEAGCGEGMISARLAKKGYKVTLLDISKQALHEAKNNIKKITGKNNSKNVNYVEGDIFKLPFEKDAYDVVWNQGVLEHFTEPEKAIKEMYRVTRQDGTVAILVPYKYSPLHLYDIVLRKLNLEKLWPFEEQIFYSKSLLAKQLINATNEKPIVKIIPFALGFSIIGYVVKTKS